MTGMYPSRVHNTRNGNESFPAHPPVISKLIAETGYECGLVGKFHLQSAGYRTEPRIDDGYTYWKFSHAPRDDWEAGHDYAQWVRQQGGDLDEMRQSENRVPADLHQTTWASDMAIEFIRKKRTYPWLLSVNIYDPHPPFIPPRRYLDKFQSENLPGPYFRDTDLAQQAILAGVDFQGEVRTPQERNARQIQAAYYAMLALIDDQFARLMNAVEETGQIHNTVVIFTSDHGESLGDHGLLEKGCRFYEGLVRVPLIFSCPDRFQQDVRSDALVELLDKTATIVELCGLAQPEYMQGNSLLPILIGDKTPGTHREYVRCEYFDALDSQFTGGSGTYATMYRNRNHKLCVYHGHGLGELYDMESDPWEFTNLWGDSQAQDLKRDLLHASFDAHVLHTTDVGSQRIAPM